MVRQFIAKCLAMSCS